MNKRLWLLAALAFVLPAICSAELPTAGELVSSAAAETSHVIKAKAGRLYAIEFYNGNGAIRYLQVHDATSLPANGAVPRISIPVAATTGISRVWYPVIYFGTGIVVANSTTQATLTIGAADSFFSVVTNQ